MKLLIDMNLSPEWAQFLSAAGFESVHWSRIGAATAPDTEIMAFASAQGYVVLTQDLDFSAILAATHLERPSVVQIRSEDLSPARIGKLILNALKEGRSDLQSGALLTVDSQRIRLRLLPFPQK
jgi:predicted nuclease of predicted toxin-antitoxin system